MPNVVSTYEGAVVPLPKARLVLPDAIVRLPKAVLKFPLAVVDAPQAVLASPLAIGEVVLVLKIPQAILP